MKKTLPLSSYQNLYDSAFKRAKNQPMLMEFLREHSYVLVSSEILKEMGSSLTIEKAHEDYSFMVRPLRTGLYDTFFAVAIKLLGTHREKVHVYFNHRFLQTHFLPSSAKKINFSKMKMVWRFSDPNMPDYDDRKDWRAENAKVLRGPKYQPTEWYLKHAEEIYKLSSQKMPSHLISYLRNLKEKK